jgi:hypothetical protein
MDSEDDSTPGDLINFRIVLRNGITISGPISESVLPHIIRDPSNLSSVVHEIPAGAAVAIALPPSVIDEYSIEYPE